MSHAMGFVATLCAALFCGAAVYINLVEHPARMSCGIRMALAQWAPSYKRAAVMQASLAILSSVAGVAVWALGGGSGWLLVALLIGAVVPYKMVVTCRPIDNCWRLIAIQICQKRGSCWRSGAVYTQFVVC